MERVLVNTQMGPRPGEGRFVTLSVLGAGTLGHRGGGGIPAWPFSPGRGVAWGSKVTSRGTGAGRRDLQVPPAPLAAASASSCRPRGGEGGSGPARPGPSPAAAPALLPRPSLGRRPSSGFPAPQRADTLHPQRSPTSVWARNSRPALPTARLTGRSLPEKRYPSPASAPQAALRRPSRVGGEGGAAGAGNLLQKYPAPPQPVAAPLPPPWQMGVLRPGRWP